jgi:hypothetical protein
VLALLGWGGGGILASSKLHKGCPPSEPSWSRAALDPNRHDMQEC